MKLTIPTIAFFGVLAIGVGSASAASPGYCDSYARDYAGQRAGGNVVGGVLTGAIGGALIGGILGGRHGAGTGAVIGGVGGGIVGGSSWQSLYNRAYYRCINSGPSYAPHTAYQAQYAIPPAGSPAWKQQCSTKYRSFDWGSGTFLAYDGSYKTCQLP
jgi:hypothetical protein